MLLKGKVAFITGGASGIGKEIAVSFAREGAIIALCDVNKIALRKAFKDLPKGSISHQHIPMDVSSQEQVDSAVEKVLQEYSKIDLLISNAGVVTRNSLVDLSLDDWDRIYNVNVRGAFLLTRAVARHFIERNEGGSIVYIASTAGLIAMDRMAHYASSKAALIHFARCIAMELGPHKIRVNTICPGPTDTPFLGHEVPVSQDFLKRHNILLGKVATPEDIAEATLFLVSPAAGHITGATLPIDGGETI